MTGTKPGWKVALKAGDRLNVSATYDTSKASWYESMGIMVVFFADGTGRSAKDPFSPAVDTQGPADARAPAGEQQPRRQGAPRAAATRATLLQRTVHEQRLHPELRLRRRRLQPARQARPPAGREGGAVAHLHEPRRDHGDLGRSSRRTTRSPRARRPVPRPPGSPTRSPTRRSSSTPASWATARAGFTPAANRNTWKTPKSLRPGTYTYFCRIHPFMRGSFRVVSDKGK